MTERTQRKRVILADLCGGHFTQDVLRGVNRYAREHGRWIVTQAENTTAGMNELLRTWRPDGVLLRGSDRLPVGHRLFRTRLPVVEFDLRLAPPRLPTISADHAASGRQAADYLLGRGFRQFATYTHHVFADQRLAQAAFEARVSAAGCACVSIETTFRRKQDWSLSLTVRRLARDLERLPKPLGIFLGWDSDAGRLFEACDQQNLRIPEDVVLIGRGNNEPYCESVWPALTSIDMNGGQVGFTAAQRLDAMMHGERFSREPLFVPLGLLVERMSTDIVALADAKVAAALRFIREQCPAPLTVHALSRRVGISRRSLEKRFQAALDKSPAREIRRLRMEHARHILTRSSLPIGQVSELCGYVNPSDFVRNFRAEFGMTPKACRLQTQGARAPN